MAEMLRKLRIGNVVLDNNLILAPMAGVTDLPFRLLCREHGAGLVCMEMVSAKAIYFRNKNTEELMAIHEGERPVSLQLFGSDADIVSAMAEKIEERPFDILDINMGCPVPKVVNNGEGSALMKNPKLAEEIIAKTVKAVRKPVTVKIRKGFDENSANAVEIAKIAEDCGAAAVAVHGRTREQYYGGKADWDIIARVKEAVKIPVIGNGDVTDGPSAKAMLEQTGCDGLMVGRAARGNPWIFEKIAHYLKTGETLAAGKDKEARDTILRHAAMCLEHKGEYTAVREMRKHIAWYTSGYPNSAAFRRNINEIESFEELERAVNGIFGL
ncbi:MAG: tRNA dihydrouridine synthase DusB [Clostridium sp.]|nr:tRNA dihydrouridine synthase DusB [Clostridium sp.]